MHGISHDGCEDVFRLDLLFYRVSVGLLVERSFLGDEWGSGVAIPVPHVDCEVKVIENLMLLYLLQGQSELWVGNEYLAQKVSHLVGHKLVVLRLAELHFLVDPLGRVSVEWGLSGDNFYHEDSEAPDINFVAMTVVPSQDLWSDVSGCPAISEGLLVDFLESFGKAKVYELDVAPLCHGNDYVFGLQVSVNDIVVVEVLETVKHLCCVVNHSLLDSLVILSDLAQECAALDVF